MKTKVEIRNNHQELDVHVKELVTNFADGLKKENKYEFAFIEIHNENEYGNDLSGEAIFEIIEKNFKKEHENDGFEIYHMVKINEIVIYIGVKE